MQYAGDRKDTNYHSQGNGLTEQLNGTVISFLRQIVQDSVHDWDLNFLRPY